MATVVQTNMKTALAHLTARYRALSTYAKQISDIVKATGKPTPCEIVDDYAKAWKDYFVFGNQIFDELARRNIKVEQIVYRNGKPVQDAVRPDHVKTLTIASPLMPPTFTVDVDRCPKATRIGDFSTLRGFSASRGFVTGQIVVGLIPLPIIAAYAIGGLILVGVTGYLTAKALEQIRLTIRPPDYNPDKRVEAYLKCVENLRNKGASIDVARTQCFEVTQAPPETSMAKWIGPVAFAALAVGGGYLFLKAKGD